MVRAVAVAQKLINVFSGREAAIRVDAISQVAKLVRKRGRGGHRHKILVNDRMHGIALLGRHSYFAAESESAAAEHPVARDRRDIQRYVYVIPDYRRLSSARER
jgi:hypothetical protein